MSLVAAGIMAGAGLAQSLFGASKAASERRKMNALLDRQQADNQTWYNANALGDYTQRADVQNLMRNLRENLRKGNDRIANTAAITGATPESVAAQKESASKTIADTYANMGAIGQQWKDKVRDRYIQQKQAIDNARYNSYAQAASAGDAAMSTGIKTMLQAGISYGLGQLNAGAGAGAGTSTGTSTSGAYQGTGFPAVEELAKKSLEGNTGGYGVV